MKTLAKLSSILVLWLTLLPVLGMAQVPQGLNYQAVLRFDGKLMVEDSVQMTYLLFQGSIGSGTLVYEESHSAMTNEFGLINLTIGEGTALMGNFEDIDWTDGQFYVEVEAKRSGIDYQLGEMELKSVPFSMQSQRASFVDTVLLAEMEDIDLNNLNQEMVLRYDGIKWIPSSSIDSIKIQGSGLSVQNQGPSIILENTGDPDASDDITNTTVATGDLGGTFPSLQVEQIQGNPVSSTNPALNQVLKWDGSEWAPHNDENTTHWNQDSLGISYGSGHVAIGMTDPKEGLHVSPTKSVLFGDSINGQGPKLFWHANRKAFRAGRLAFSGSRYWDQDSLGVYSASTGTNTRALGFASFSTGEETQAKGDRSFAAGRFTQAIGQTSTALGNWSVAKGISSLASGDGPRANGNFSTALGYATHADSRASVALGAYNIGGGNVVSWVLTDPIFEVGIGENLNARKNALTILKNGQVAVGVGSQTPQTHSSMTIFSHDTTSGNNQAVRSLWVENRHNNYSGPFATEGIVSTAYRTGASSARVSGGLFSAQSANSSSSLNVGIQGTASKNGGGTAYGVYGAVSGTANIMYAGYFSGNVYSTGSFTTSDQNLKTGIQARTLSSLALISQLPVRTYTYKTAEYPHMNLPEGPQTGLVAQEVEQLFPELVKETLQPATNPDMGSQVGEEVHFKAVNYAGLIPHLVKAIQEQQQKIEELEAQIQALKNN